MSFKGISHHILHYVHILSGEMEGERKKRGDTRKRRKIKQEHGGRKVRERERYHRELVRDSLSYGINGGLMGYERMFYWKQ